MKNLNIETLYVDNIEQKTQGTPINIISSASSGQTLNLIGSLLYNSSYGDQGTVNNGRQLIISGYFVASSSTLTQSGGINTVSTSSTGVYSLSCASDLFTSQPYAVVSANNAASGSYNICSATISSSSGLYTLTINTYSGSTGSTASNPALAAVDFSFIIIGQSN